MVKESFESASTGASTTAEEPAASTTLVEESIAVGLTADNVIKDHVIASVAVATVPLPLVDVAGIAAIQLRMIQKLSQLYGKPFSDSLGRSVIASLAGSVGGLTAGALASSLVKVIPGVGWALSVATLPLVAGSSTYAIGRVFVKHYQAGGSLADLDAAKFKAFYREQFEKGKELARRAKDEAKLRAAAVKDAASGATPAGASSTATP
ncbi:YcjF family protein [Azospirillum agricola]|uniref:YcjF family protein n=1 Tax=Azospirillum agricola TaxID=1720247 RepID=UPI000A0F3117|nr:YcjF family protein [Azospirillum agricola]MBP2229021.1 uncharacterized protein (DUF697 family) [Azospirillum agricola]SMH62107.1 Uncharacterized conserved protein, DUF697 family [Azospirillum lipoferum]